VYSEPIGELARVHECERRRTLAAQQLNSAAGNGFDVV
jgi:hypothetical protein